MFKTFLAIVVILCQFTPSYQRSTPEDDSYVAAAVEYQVHNDVAINLQHYVEFIRKAAEQDVDILVFPEMTLTCGTRSIIVSINGELKIQPVPALQPDKYDEILVAISAAAREHQIYVLINIQEKMDCTITSDEHCPEEKVYMFNTNVVFDRNGAVIDRYRKINLFGEYNRNPALTPDLGVFTTDFGVTFGHFICFDLMFQVPAIQVVQKHNITNVLFSTMWFSEMPFLTAVQIQEAYAYAQNVNLIGSGANNVRIGSAGSGIYSGKAGALVSVMPGVPTTKLLIATVPKIPGKVSETYPGPYYDHPSDHDVLDLVVDTTLPSQISRPLVPGFQEFTLVDKEVSCQFRVRLNHRDGKPGHRYRAFVQDGSTTYSRREIGVASCLVVACKTQDPKSCVYRFNKNEANVEINELEINMVTIGKQYNKTLRCDNVVYFPSSFRITKFPLSTSNFTYIDSSQNGGIDLQDGGIDLQDGCDRNSRERIHYKINVPQYDLMSFGVWGRIYVRDVNHNIPVTENDIQNSLNMENVIYGFKQPMDGYRW